MRRIVCDGRRRLLERGDDIKPGRKRGGTVDRGVIRRTGIGRAGVIRRTGIGRAGVIRRTGIGRAGLSRDVRRHAGGLDLRES